MTLGSIMQAGGAAKRLGAVAAMVCLTSVLFTQTRTNTATSASVGVIVQSAPGQVRAAVHSVTEVGGTVGRHLGIIGGFTATVPATSLSALGGRPGVRAVTPNRTVHLTTDSYDGASDAGSPWRTAWSMGAANAWAGGFTGRGVDVALVDSGIAPVAGLTGAGKVVNGPDLSFDSQSDATRYLDGYGHGTHLAGIIAGRDPSTTGDQRRRRDFNDFIGVAPDARLVNVKVADSTGATDVSQVIAGIDWVVQHRQDNGLNIRVLNLSFGTDGAQSYRDDPLAFAAEVAWRNGIVVVVAAGNEGTGLGRLSNPGVDPFVMSVGADATAGTPSVSDDAVPDFSSRGDGTRNPDVVAPGKSLVSLRVPGSWIDKNHPEGLVNDRYFRGSGTSQAAATVSGAAADLLQQRPALTPDQVKALLTTTALPLSNTPAVAQGAGLVNVAAALRAGTPDAVQSFVRSTGSGSLDAARGSLHLEQGGVRLDGERDIFGQPFDADAMARVTEAGSSWSGGTWNGSTWSGSSWSGSSWSGSSWSGSTWSGSSWSGSSWSGSTWSGSTWSGSSWSDAGWGDPTPKAQCSGRACLDRGSNTQWGS
ncbi:MAG: peptidase and in kexin sedolisin [Acidimicrobiales bacterium]|nr:peptidase and in kexin sedolisin [Acidimicrobiales bacterium]